MIVKISPSDQAMLFEHTQKQNIERESRIVPQVDDIEPFPSSVVFSNDMAMQDELLPIS
jgi:hypothetical protein